jgi:hypothetical protein
MTTNIFFTFWKEFETTFKICELQISLPKTKQVMDRLREITDWTELANEIGD